MFLLSNFRICLVGESYFWSRKLFVRVSLGIVYNCDVIFNEIFMNGKGKKLNFLL